MLDINLFREDKGGNPELVRKSQAARFADVSLVDQVMDLDAQWRKANHVMMTTKREKNEADKAVGAAKKAKQTEGVDELVAKSVALKKAVVDADADVKRLADERDSKLKMIGNIIHESVPVFEKEVHNVVVRKWGEERGKEDWMKHHDELLFMIGGYRTDEGRDVAGHRGFFYTGPGVLLDQAVAAYGQSFLMKRGFLPIVPPFLMRRDVMAETAQLADFDEALYKVVEKEGEDKDPKYLIATSEQPISAFHRKKWLEPKELPLKYAGFSTNFRKEAGKFGQDTWGVFRVHQFNKVEQFVVCSPHDNQSWEWHEKMIANAEEFNQSLGIPYRVINIVSGDLNDAAAKKYDLEAWFPGYQDYKELVSASNCTDYQSRRLEARYGSKKGSDETKSYVHMLNATLCATTRTVCALLETHQTEEGVKVPEVLQPFMGGIDFLPFVNPCPDRILPGGKKVKAKK